MTNENNHLGSPHVWNDGRYFGYGWCIPVVSGLVGGTVGDYVKEYAKTGIPTDKEIEVRKTYSEVRRK